MVVAVEIAGPAHGRRHVVFLALGHVRGLVREADVAFAVDAVKGRRVVVENAQQRADPECEKRRKVMIAIAGAVRDRHDVLVRDVELGIRVDCIRVGRCRDVEVDVAGIAIARHGDREQGNAVLLASGSDAGSIVVVHDAGAPAAPSALLPESPHERTLTR